MKVCRYNLQRALKFLWGHGNTAWFAQLTAVLVVVAWRRRLTGLEAGRLRDEQQQLNATITDLQVRGFILYNILYTIIIYLIYSH